MAHVKDVFDYAKNNFRTLETFANIQKINDILSKELKIKHKNI